MNLDVDVLLKHNTGNSYNFRVGHSCDVWIFGVLEDELMYDLAKFIVTTSIDLSRIQMVECVTVNYVPFREAFGSKCSKSLGLGRIL